LDVKLSPKTNGRIEYLEVNEGDRVQAGQVLVRLDPSEIDAEVTRARAALAESASRLAQGEISRSSTDAGVTTQIRQQQAAVSVAEADLHQVRENFNAQVATAQSAVAEAQSRIESADAAIANAQAGIKSAQANLENARTKQNRISDLYKQGFIAAQDVDDARTAVSVQQGALDVAQGQLDSARALRSAAAAQKDSATKQVQIVQTKGKSDIRAAQARVQQAKAALEMARANRVQRPAYQANLAALRSAVDASRAAVGQAEARRADTVLRSPISGVVTDRQMDPGSMATPSQPILTLQAIRQVWVTTPVPEEINRKVRLGQSALVKFDGIPNRAFTGRVVQVNPAADPASRQFNVRVGLDNSQGLLKPGMFARVTLSTDLRSSVVTIPREAVQQSAEGPIAVVVESEEAKHRPLTLGASDSAGFEVVRGLQAGEKVVVLSGAPVKDGAKVRVAGKKPAAGNTSPAVRPN
jgi:RND family efflux transporter MFP subunit